MWKLLKFFGAIVKTVFWLALILVLSGIIVLYLFEQDIPPTLVTRLSDALSSNDYLCRIGRATYSLKSGLHLYQVRAFQKRVADTALLSADDVEIDFSIRPHLALGERIQGVTIRNIRVPTLPQKQHKTEANTNAVASLASAAPKTDSAADLHLPAVSPFPIVIENADILGLQAERVSATLAIDDAQISVTQVAIRWPDKNFTMDVDGHVTVDLKTRLVNGNAKGQAFPGNILPLLTALHSKGAIKQINCFSSLERPVNADATFAVNIDNSDFSLVLALDVGPCAYRGVPIKYAKGTVSAYGTNIYTSVVVYPLQAESSTGPIAGKLIYREESESLEIDASSAMDLQQTVSVINILNHGELKPIQCAKPVHLTTQGIIALDTKKSTVKNALTGKISFEEGTILNVGVRDVTCDLKINGYSASFDNVRGSSLGGGKIAGGIIFDFPNYSATSTLFTTSATLANMSFSDFSKVLKITDTRAGKISINMALLGRPCNRTIATLAGEGNLTIRDSLISRMPVFAGFTDQLARHVPGVSSLVNQSSGSMDFSVENGILRTDNLVIEGDVFSMNGRGTCDLETEALDFVMRVNFLKKESIVGRIAHLVTLPITKLLLEFKVFGTLDKSDWSYVNIIDKITDNLPSITGQSKTTSEPPAPPSTPVPER